MKKLMIAASVSAALAAPAMAQNVSVYGVVGMSYDQVELSGVSQTRSSSFDPLSSSRIGVRGTEDLGGGMKATFILEGDLNTTNGTGDGTGAVGGITFDREASIELDLGNGVKIKSGKIPNATKRIDSGASAGTNLLDVAAFNLSTDVSGSVGVTAKLGAVDIWAQYSNDVTPTVSGTSWGALSQSVGLVTEAAAYAGYGAGITLAGVNFKLATSQQGASAETVLLADTTIEGITIQALASRSDTGAANGKSSNTQLGFIYPVAGVNLRATVGRVGADTKTTEYKYMGLLVDKPLSKRTSVYVGYADKDVNNGVTNDQTISTVGIVHSF
jgi:predicted porin